MLNTSRFEFTLKSVFSLIVAVCSLSASFGVESRESEDNVAVLSETRSPTVDSIEDVDEAIGKRFVNADRSLRLSFKDVEVHS